MPAKSAFRGLLGDTLAAQLELKAASAHRFVTHAGVNPPSGKRFIIQVAQVSQPGDDLLDDSLTEA